MLISFDLRLLGPGIGLSREKSWPGWEDPCSVQALLLVTWGQHVASLTQVPLPGRESCMWEGHVEVLGALPASVPGS